MRSGAQTCSPGPCRTHPDVVAGARACSHMHGNSAQRGSSLRHHGTSGARDSSNADATAATTGAATRLPIPSAHTRHAIAQNRHLTCPVTLRPEEMAGKGGQPHQAQHQRNAGRLQWRRARLPSPIKQNVCAHSGSTLRARIRCRLSRAAVVLLGRQARSTDAASPKRSKMRHLVRPARTRVGMLGQDYIHACCEQRGTDIKPPGKNKRQATNERTQLCEITTNISSGCGQGCRQPRKHCKPAVRPGAQPSNGVAAKSKEL